MSFPTPESLVVGKTLGQYEILDPLGSGGMGDVYRALDTNLKRHVAIKVLPEDLAADRDRLERLRREAPLLASLNHPNIAAIYNLEQTDEARWLVLELVEGETLEQRLREGRLPVGESVRIARGIAAALEAAHEKDIVHRDLKAANVMVDDKGRVKVLDFGIAKDVGGALGDAVDTGMATRAEQLTATGVLIGTVPYMSPEQIRGQRIDKRTDNWAFGCLLFELLAGRRPFDRETTADTLSAVLEHEPDWSALPGSTPEAVKALIGRCLRKDPDRRLHDIADARAELEEVASASAPTVATAGDRLEPSARLGLAATGVGLVLLVGIVGWGLWSALPRAGTDAADPAGPGAAATAAALGPDSVAVLPFDVVSRDPDAEFLAAGLEPEILRRLRDVTGLSVSSWASSSRLQAGVDDPREHGRRLGVAKVLEGVVQVSGETLRVNLTLTDVATGETLWTDRADLARDDLDTVFPFQEAVAVEIARVLELELSAESQRRLASRPTENAAAYNAYARAMELWPRSDAPSLFEARDYLEDAIEHDPDFALAHAYRGTVYLMLRQFAGYPDAEAYTLARESAEQALALDNGIGRAHAVLARVMANTNVAGWQDHYETALELSPNDALTYANYAWELALGQGGTPKVRALWARALELDPESPLAHESMGIISLADGRFDEAIGYYNRALELDSEYPLAYMGLGHVLNYSGRAEAALQPLRESVRLNSVDFRYTMSLSRALADLGRVQAAIASLNAWALLNPGDHRPYMELGDVYLDMAGDIATAAEMYGRAEEITRAQLLDGSATGRQLRDRGRILARLAQTELDRGDAAAAAAWIAREAEIPARTNGFLPYARMELELFRGRPDEAARIARELAGTTTVRTYYQANGRIYRDNRPRDPLGYAGVIVDRPAESRLFFETNYPELLGDDSPVHGLTLKATIDLAAVLMHTGESARAAMLLERAEDWLDAVPEDQRRAQFRTAPMEIYALQGRVDDAFDAIRQAFDDGWRSGWWRLRTKPHFAALRGDERWDPWIERLRSAAQW